MNFLFSTILRGRYLVIAVLASSLAQGMVWFGFLSDDMYYCLKFQKVS